MSCANPFIRLPVRLGALASFAYLGACGTVPQNPGPLWILGATARSLVGMPPTPPDYYAEPVRVSETLEFIAITAGSDHTCALTVDGDTYCWGSSQHEQLGSASLSEICANGTFACSATPVRIEGAPRFTAIAASMWGTCGLDRSGAAYCWGYGLGGRGGDSLPAGSPVPLAVPGGHTFASLHSNASGNRTCGLTREGEVWCWRANIDGANGGVATSDASGQDGYGDGVAGNDASDAGTPGNGEPPAFTGPERVATTLRFVSMSYGAAHGCGIDETRKVYCWGSNRFGQLGIGRSELDGGIAASVSPVEVHGDLRLEAVAVGPNSSCGLDTARSVHCWGLGFPLDSSIRVPDRRTFAHGALPLLVSTPPPTFSTLAATTTLACMLSTAGEVYCSSTSPTVSPAARPAERVASDHAFVAVAVGGSHACAIGTDAAAYCWGSSHVGQVGRKPGRD